MYYILDENKNPVKSDLETMSQFLYTNNSNKLIKQNYIGDKFVSTVFLGIDHSFNIFEDKTPILFETMIFNKNSRCEDYCERYSTYDESLKGHQRAIDSIKNKE
jgi:hypothetical protein